MSDWLRYEWEWDNRPITVQVDLQYWQLLPTLAYAHLIYIACAPRNPDAAAFTRQEEKSLEALYAGLQDALQGNAIHVGLIETPAFRQYYFYTDDPSLLNRASALCRSATKLATTYGQVEEPQYKTYYRFLFPDDAKLQSVENAEFIADVVRHGGDVDCVRRIDMLMAFPNFEARESYIHMLPRLGLTIGASDTNDHPTHAYRIMVHGYSTLHLEDLNRCTTRAIRSAAQLDGLLDELDAEFIERH